MLGFRNVLIHEYVELDRAVDAVAHLNAVERFLAITTEIAAELIDDR